MSLKLFVEIIKKYSIKSAISEEIIEKKIRIHQMTLKKIFLSIFTWLGDIGQKDKIFLKLLIWSRGAPLKINHIEKELLEKNILQYI